MKPINFFIQKTESFLEELRSIELIPFDLESVTDDIYKDPIESKTKGFSEQSYRLKEIKFQMNLMFQEFDKGELFEKRLNSFKKLSIFTNSYLLNHLIEVNILFSNFLKEYRVE